MKTLQLFLAIMLLTGFQAFGQEEEKKDKNKDKDKRIHITFGDDDIDDIDDNDEDHDDDDDDDDNGRRAKVRFGMVDLGVSSYLADDGGFNMPDEYSFMDQRLARSVNVGVHIINAKLGLSGKGKPAYIGISTALRLNLAHYSFENDFRLEADKETFFDAVNLEVDPLNKSRLYASYIAIPAMIEINTNPRNPSKSFNLAFGYVHQLLLNSNHRYKTENKEKTKVKDDFNLNKSMGMLEGRIGYGPLNFYVQYGLDRLFQAGKGPELTPINIGVNIIPR